MDMEVELQKPGFNLLDMPCSGDASEKGLLKFVEPMRSARSSRLAWPKLFEIKFNSVNKWQLSIHKSGLPCSSHPLCSASLTHSALPVRPAAGMRVATLRCW